MKKTKEIIGLPIISISDGMEAGKVKSLLINADKGTVDFVVVDNGTQILSVNVIPTERVLGIGEYALTIESDSDISEISKIPAAVDLLQKNIKVKNTKILTKKGRLIGETGDIFVDEDKCCSIEGLEFIADITQKQIRVIPRKSVITFGKNLIVVIEDVEASLLDSEAKLGSDEMTAEAEKKNLVDSDSSTVNAYIAPETPEIPVDVNETTVQNDMAGMEENAENDDVASLFEEKQKQYLNGRKATKTITDNSGNVIISEGMIITNEIIDAAKLQGKLVDLVMNNKA